MKKITKNFVMGALCLIFMQNVLQATAQQPKIQSNPVKIGEQLPESFWRIKHTQLINGKIVKTDLSAYRGKLLILDFWATWCTSCISDMPSVHKLAQDFNKEIYVLPVAYERNEKVTPFIQTNNYVKALKLSSIVQDTILAKIFPHRTIPHCVWISKEGKVITFSSSEQINKNSIELALKTGSSASAPKIDQDTKRPLFLSEALPINQLSAYAILVKDKYTGLPSGVRYEYAGDTVIGATITNQSLSSIYKTIASNLLSPETNKRTINSAPINDTTTFSYQYRNTNLKKGELFKAMLAHLNSVTGWNAYTERRATKCLVLTMAGNKSSVQNYDQQTQRTLLDYDKTRKIKPVERLVNKLNRILPAIVLNGTDFDGVVDLSQLKETTDYDTLKQTLKNMGFDLQEEQIPLEVFILQTNNSTIQTAK